MLFDNVNILGQLEGSTVIITDGSCPSGFTKDPNTGRCDPTGAPVVRGAPYQCGIGTGPACPPGVAAGTIIVPSSTTPGGCLDDFHDENGVCMPNPGVSITIREHRAGWDGICSPGFTKDPVTGYCMTPAAVTEAEGKKVTCAGVPLPLFKPTESGGSIGGRTRLSCIPFPTGSKYAKTSRGWQAVLIPATAEITANAQEWLAATRASTSATVRAKADATAAGNMYYGWPLTLTSATALNFYGTSPPAGRPEVVNAARATGGKPGWFIYDNWFWFLGTATKGNLVLINTPYFAADFDVIPWISDPLSTLTAGLKEAFSAVLQAVVDIVTDVIGGITDALKTLLCNIGPVGAIATAAGGAYFGGKGGLVAATTAYTVLCGQQSACPIGTVQLSDGTCACPTGYVKDPASGTCVEETSPWLYAGIAGGALVVGGLLYGAFKKKKVVTP